jgi:pimeloyl-ACP methyl ester carboxylesterase
MNTHEVSETTAEPLDHLVILVHGIRTKGLWMSEVKPALEKAGFWVAPTSYGVYGISRFLSPFRGFRDAPINRVTEDIRTAINAFKIDRGTEPKRMSVISHSFGTYVVSKILLEVPDLEWYRVIFCGSVVRDDFPLQQVLKRFKFPLLTLQLPFLQVSESMGNYDSKIVDAASVD